MLPSKADQLMLRAFTVTVALGAAAVTGALVAVAAAPLFGVAGALAAGVAISLAGRVRPRWFATGYRYWARLERAYARRARRLLTGLIHYAIMTPVGRLGGSSGFWQAPSAPGWIRHEPAGPGVRADATWWGGVWARARGPGRGWVLALVPFIAALRLLDRLDARSGREVPTTMYTLY
jgi:hypothetical protein